MDRGKNVESFVENLIESGEYKWVNENLVKDISQHSVTLNSEEEEALRELSTLINSQPDEIIKNAIHNFLLNPAKGVRKNEN